VASCSGEVLLTSDSGGVGSSDGMVGCKEDSALPEQESGEWKGEDRTLWKDAVELLKEGEEAALKEEVALRNEEEEETMEVEEQELLSKCSVL